MKIGLVGTYPPRQCGIATFSHNLLSAIIAGSTDTGKPELFVIAMNDNDEGYDYPEEVKFTIRQNIQSDYIKAAEYINVHADICILQHEYGIFGEEDGVYILSLLNRLTIPFITTLHTILKQPAFLQKIILQQIALRASKIVVMSRLAMKFLKTIYEVPEEKIELIEHGVPDVEEAIIKDQEFARFENNRVLFTFGFLSRNKGLETVIKALPSVVKNHPDIVYVILGKTHPGVLKRTGEEYRNYLKELAVELHVEKHVYFIDKFVTDEQLFAYLKSIDIYITPYLNEAQITSGTLSYAIGAGAAVVSTPYWHAQELLANDRGKLFPFKDSRYLSKILNTLLEDSVQMASIRNKAYQYGQHLKWPLLGAKYIEVAVKAIQRFDKHNAALDSILYENSMPDFSLNHLQTLTDDTGIIQHAKYGIPNLKEGYCLDDNARAVITVLMSYEQFQDRESLRLLPVYLSFIHYMQRDDGRFRNFLHFNRSYLDDIGSEDSFGRTIWALGYLICYAPNNSYREFGRETFLKSLSYFTELHDLRGIANTIIGISYYMKTYHGDEGMLDMLKQLTKKLKKAYTAYATSEWHWFESHMTYDNSILPLALLHSCEITRDEPTKNIGLEALAFLEKKTLYKEYLTPVGNEGWHSEEGEMPLFDQQAIEVMAMSFMYQQAFMITKNPQYIKNISTCFAWFLGKNELYVPLYDPETNACCDGLRQSGINRNQGAESTLSYLTSYLIVQKTMAWQYHYDTKEININKKIKPIAV